MQNRFQKLAWGIAYCLAYDRGMNAATMGTLRQLVEGESIPQGLPGDDVALIAESSRLIFHPIEGEKEQLQTKEALRSHRLAQLSEWLNSPSIALVMGGATKIKQYVFESAKLPEIRGASGLLDRINLCDVRALFTEKLMWVRQLHEATELQEAKELVTQVRGWFRVRYSTEPPECEESIIYANGGEVLAFASVKLAGFLTDAIESLYTKETLIANSVAVWHTCSLMELRFGLRPIEFWTDDLTAVRDDSLKEWLRNYYGGLDSDSFLSRKRFGECAAAVALEKLQRREGNKVNESSPKPVPHFETLPYAKRCTSCERRAAVVLRQMAGEQQWLCEPCARKSVFGQRAKKEGAEQTAWFDKAGFDWRPLAAKAWATRFEEWLSKEDQNALRTRYYEDAPRVQPAEDLDNIAAAAQPEGFIGVIYADGNNIGALLERLQTAAEYQEFAHAVYEETMEATFTALAKHLHPHRLEGRWLHPFEVLSVGGDDVFLIVPAHAALPIALTMAHEAEKHLSRCGITQERRGYDWRQVHRIAPPSGWQAPAVQSKVSLSSGVVIADHHTPVFFLRRLVEDLLRSAKAKAKRLRDRDFYGATVDFIALKSVGMIATNVRDFRESALQRGELYLTAKPYTVPELDTLLEAVKTLKQADFPKSQLYKLREQLTKGRLASTVDYLYFQSRSRYRDDLRFALDVVWTGVERPGRVGAIAPWLRREQDEWETVMSDLVEIYDFVPEGSKGDGE